MNKIPNDIYSRIEKRPLIGADIRNELQKDSILEKPYQHSSNAMNEAIQQCNLPDDLRDKLTNMPSRNGLHLLRMLRRSEVERNFGLAYLKHSAKIFSEDKEDMSKVFNIIASEGQDTMMFWTFAPYLLKSLITMGLDEKKSIQLILLWAKSGASFVSESIKSKDKAKDFNLIHLEDLQQFNRETNGGWVLDVDPNHISHKFTEQEAKPVAENLFYKNLTIEKIFREIKDFALDKLDNSSDNMVYLESSDGFLRITKHGDVVVFVGNDSDYLTNIASETKKKLEKEFPERTFEVFPQRGIY